MKWCSQSVLLHVWFSKRTNVTGVEGLRNKRAWWRSICFLLCPPDGGSPMASVIGCLGSFSNESDWMCGLICGNWRDLKSVALKTFHNNPSVNHFNSSQFSFIKLEHICVFYYCYFTQDINHLIKILSYTNTIWLDH